MSPISRELLDKYIRGGCTSEESDAVHHWLDENDIDDYRLPSSIRRMGKKADKNWLQLTEQLEELKPVSRTLSRGRFPWGKMAASVIGILVLATGIFFYFRYGHGGREYQTTYGEVKRVNLTDGTIVTLNARSSLRISPGFNTRNRRVYLKGEAYFQVKRKAAKPFVVNTGGAGRRGALTVTALGTSFDVSAFSDDPTTTIALKDGKVMVKSRVSRQTDHGEVLLQPGEEVVFEKATSKLMVERKFNPKTRLAWQGQDIYFENADIGEVLRKLERFYGVSFSTDLLKPRHWQLSGEYKNQTLTDVLESLSFNYNIKYRIEGEHVILYDQ